MKNYFLTFVLSLLVVMASVSLRRSLAAIGGPTASWTSNVTSVGGAPAPPIPQAALITPAVGGAPAPPIPQAVLITPAVGGAPAPPIPQAE
jgi:hypothetical protein